MLPGNRKCSMTSLADTKRYIQRKKERKKKRWGIQFCSWLRPRTVHVLRKARARRDYKLSSLGKIFLNTRKAISRLRKQRHFTKNQGSASDWLNHISRAAGPIRSTTQNWLVTRHQYGISALVSHTSIRGETVGGVAKSRLFSQVKKFRISKRPYYDLFINNNNNNNININNNNLY